MPTHLEGKEARLLYIECMLVSAFTLDALVRDEA